MQKYEHTKHENFIEGDFYDYLHTADITSEYFSGKISDFKWKCPEASCLYSDADRSYRSSDPCQL